MASGVAPGRDLTIPGGPPAGVVRELPSTTGMHSRRQAGYGMIEIAAILAIMWLAVRVSYDSIRPRMPEARLDVAARELTGDIRKARQTAIARGNNVVLTFEVGTDRYRVWEDVGSDGFMSVDEEERIVPLPPGIDLLQALFGNTSQLTFQPTGSAAAGGSVTMRSNSVATARIEVTRANGRFKCTLID